jgi:photosystem II stability/assembly factor-like uncharacterized protein
MKKRLDRIIALLALVGLMQWPALLAPASTAARQTDQVLAPTSATATPPNRARHGDQIVSQRLCDRYNKLPLRFEPVESRADAAGFIARDGAHSLLLTAAEGTVALPSSDAAGEHERPAAFVRWRLVGADAQAQATGLGELPGTINHFVGRDPERWRIGSQAFARVRFAAVYPGVNMVYYGRAGQLEYDFNVAPGASYRAIRWRFDGARRVRLDATGDLILETPAGQIRHRRPIAYQDVSGARREVACRFVLRRSHEVGFAVGFYDRSRPLVIDPVLDFAALLGDAAAASVAVDAAGNIYLAGSVYSACLPSTPGAVQPSYAGGNTCFNCRDAFVTKLDPSSTTIIYSTYLGGSDLDDALAIAVDASGNAYVTGQTGSKNFPVTPEAFQIDLFDQSLDAFVTKLNPSGTALVYSTYLGGHVEDQATAIAVDASGNAYVGGSTRSSNFPTRNAVQSQFRGGTCLSGDAAFFCHDAFIAKFDPAGALVYSTFVGGNGEDHITGLAVDASANVYATGMTTSSDFPTTARAFQTSYRGDPGFSDAFVLKLNAAGSAFVYSTYLGGAGADVARGIALNAAGEAYITGSTGSTNFPLTSQAIQPLNASRSFFKSTNGGSSWSADSAGLSSDSPILSLAIDPTAPATLYVGTASGLYKSMDGGQSFRTRLVDGYVSQVVVDPKNPANVYAISNGLGVTFYKSTDGGAHWTIHFILAIYNIAQAYSLLIDPQNPATLYVSTNDDLLTGLASGVVKSTDAGTTWQVASEGLPDTGNGVTAMAIDPSHPTTLYASNAATYRTANGGLKWKLINGGFRFTSLMVSPADSDVLYATSGLVYKSVNGGAKWQQLGGLPPGSFTNIQIDPVAPATVFVTATDGGIFKSTDGGANWMAINAGFPQGKGFLLCIDPRNPATLYAHSAGGTDAFVTRLNADGSGLVFSTYLGGNSGDSASAIALDLAGNVYVAGASASLDFPTAEALQNAPHQSAFGVSDAFITKLSSNGAAVSYSTYLGRADARGLAVSPAGAVYVAGQFTFEGTALVASLAAQRFGTCDLSHTRHAFVLKITDSSAGGAAPRVLAVSPTSVSTRGDTEITITGDHFMPGAVVYIAGMPASDVRVLNATTIKAIAPPLGANSLGLDLAVINPDGQSNTLVQALAYLLPPIIGRVSIVGKDLIVTGANFDTGAVILLNGEKQKTTFTDITEQVVLVGKKLGKRIKPGETITLQVQNGSGLVSEPFAFTRPAQ